MSDANTLADEMRSAPPMESEGLLELLCCEGEPCIRPEDCVKKTGYRHLNRARIADAILRFYTAPEEDK